jgi:DNA-binding NarL/FixJ family response regulator
LSGARHPPKSNTPIRMAIGCSSYLLGEGLLRLLERERGIEVIGIFNESADFRQITKMKPDIAILDFNIFTHLPRDLTGDTKTKMLVIGHSGMCAVSDRKISGLISRGIVGILPPGADFFLLKRAIKAVSSGELWLDRKTLSKLVCNDGYVKDAEVGLTKTEKKVVSLICDGLRNKEIARKLDISEKTVKCHCNRIYKKVGVTDRLQLAAYTYKAWPDWYVADK